MAVTSGFYNSLSGDRKYDAIQLGEIFDGVITDGVFETFGGAMLVTASGTGMIINIADGRAWFNHCWVKNDSIFVLELDQSELVLDRIDAVVVEIDSSLAVRNGTIKLIKGTPASVPLKPEMVHTDEVNQYALAYITIPSGSTEITQSQIENAVGLTETPFVTGVLETLDISTLVAQWANDLSDMLTADQLEFMAWFNEMKDQLSEDAAGHLQGEIDDIHDEMDNLRGFEDFTIDSTAWIPNTNTRNNSSFALMQEIITAKTDNLDPDATLDGYVVSMTSGEVMTDAEIEDSYKICKDCVKSEHGFYVYANEATIVNLRLRVKGL